jgi:peroxiredoxin
LVQLQRDLKSIEAEGIQLVGISYDDTKVLKMFSDRIEIAFPLLSDPGSRTIDAYNLRNVSARGKAEGVPNPGTFILDRDGIIRAKLILEGFSERHTTEALIEAAKSIK